MQLSIKDSLLIQSCRNIINKVQSSIAAVKKFKTLSRNLRHYRDQLLPLRKKCELQKSNETRWNSTFIKLQSFVDLFPAFEFMIKQSETMTLNENNTHSYSSTELKFINNFLKLLERLKMATDEWQSGKSVSISLVYLFNY